MIAKTKVKKGLWMLSFLLTTVLLVFAIQDKANSRLQELSIEIVPTKDGTMLINNSDVLVHIERRYGHRLNKTLIKKLNITEVEKILEDNVFIKHAEVFIDGNYKMHLQLEQREPMMRVNLADGKDYYLDEVGVMIPLSRQASPRVMNFTGATVGYHKDFLKVKNHPLNTMFQLATSIHEDELLKPLIEQINVEEEGEYTMIPKLGDQKIILGLAENVDDKLVRLKHFYKEGMPSAGWKKYKTINLSFDGQVVCKKA